MERRLSMISTNSFKKNERKITEILTKDIHGFRYSQIKQQFKIYNLEEIFKKYALKVNHGYFSLFLILQSLISITHFLTVLIVNVKAGTLDIVLPDLILYAICAIFPIIGLFISECYIIKHPDLLKLASTIAFGTLFIVDIGIPIYHSLCYGQSYRPIYTTLLILSCYIFFGITKNLAAFLLGCSVTVVHLAFVAVVTYDDSTKLYNRIGSDFVYFICINGLGLYFRYINELVEGKGFLDRRSCVESNLDLEYNRDMEEQLMKSILPEHFIKEFQLLKKSNKFEEGVKMSPENPYKIFIKEYQNVTILYADIVNYTQMTTKLTPALKLVETLHDLFGSFDDASEKLKVMRIKFLGDCYYCVAGLPPDSIPNHAEACVDLGLEMIQIIKKVRSDRDLDIDMRIGVHTGNILGGIIGEAKWQFDVWSKDVFIANRMETTGSPGKVHITKQTKEQLKKQYIVRSTNVGANDAMLNRNGIETYLVSPKIKIEKEHIIDQKIERLGKVIEGKELFDGTPLAFIKPNPVGYQRNENRRASGNPALERRLSGHPKASERLSTNSNLERRFSGNSYLEQRNSGNLERRSSGFSERRINEPDKQRRTGFMDISINKYQQRLKETDNKLISAIEAMPFSKYEQWIQMRDINPFFLIFTNFKREKAYIFQPDALFKFNLLGEILILLGIIIIQVTSTPYWQWTIKLEICTLAIMVFILIPMAWTNFIWNHYKSKRRLSDGENDFEVISITENFPPMEPKNCIINFFYKSSTIITDNLFIRILIYAVICLIIVFSTLSQMNHCNYNELPAPKLNNYLQIALNFQKHDQKNEDLCVIPWHMTQTIELAIIISFIFLRIHVWLKCIIGAIITFIYSFLILNMTDDYYENSESFNHGMDPSIAHVLSIVYLTFTLHLIDRQSDYMNRLDYKWNEQLIKEEDSASTKRYNNAILLENILPIHVAELYLDVNRQRSLYYEEYSNIAVMFASIVDYDLNEIDEKLFLTIMHHTIGDFDKMLLNEYKSRIEKIKIANWTYMAACGLTPGRKTTSESQEGGTEVVLTLLEFAIKMRKILKESNAESAQAFKLRIGICLGDVTAGVVGSKKPLYDIWGDTVNMASRMDSTGIKDKIQVNESTAQIIMKNGYKCDFRGHIYVKGKSKSSEPDVPTYFVSLDENGDPIRINCDEITHKNI